MEKTLFPVLQRSSWQCIPSRKGPSSWWSKRFWRETETTSWAHTHIAVSSRSSEGKLNSACEKLCQSGPGESPIPAAVADMLTWAVQSGHQHTSQGSRGRKGSENITGVNREQWNQQDGLNHLRWRIIVNKATEVRQCCLCLFLCMALSVHVWTDSNLVKCCEAELLHGSVNHFSQLDKLSMSNGDFQAQKCPACTHLISPTIYTGFGISAPYTVH